MRIKLSEFMADNGIESKDELYELAEGWVLDGVVPACCSEGCEVEPDGRCEHGAPSVLLVMGLV